VQIHGVRLMLDFYKRGVLLRHGKQLGGGIKTLFYYETTMSKVMDLVMLQAVLSHVFQMNIDNVTQFSPSGSMRQMREQKIDGTNITGVLGSMMTWTETRSLMDELSRDGAIHAIAWPTTSVTHHLIAEMLGTNNFCDINLFMTNVLHCIQVPFTSFEEPKSNERKFMLADKSCYSNFHFSAGPPKESYADSYLCVMDITEGHVICRGGRMTMRIVYDQGRKSTKRVAEEVWKLMDTNPWIHP
jgi:hypothetical protein